MSKYVRYFIFKFISRFNVIGSTILIIFSALALGLGISLMYIYTHRKEEYSAGFTVTLIVLTAIIAMIILLVGNIVTYYAAARQR
jgi:hypothetical protein